MKSVETSEKERLYEKFGKPPKRENPLDLQLHNFVIVCSVGGPIYDVKKGRVTRFYDSLEEARRDHGGVGGHDGALAEEDDDYVYVRTGPATFEYCIVPIRYVLEIISPGCEWVGGEGYRPRETRRDFFGNELD